MIRGLYALLIVLVSASPAWAPPIQSVSIGPDTFTVTLARLSGLTQTFTFTRANLTSSQLTTCAANIPACEATVNTFLDSRTGGQIIVRVHIFQVNPVLLWTIGTFNTGLTIPPNWWERA